MTWDLFVSHARQDKDFVAPLVEVLQRRGLRVWYDDEVLRLGDSLRRSIDEGLARSKFGVVIISSYFLGKEWPQKELDALVAREADGTPVILPVWHKITADELRTTSPILADRFAVRSSLGVERVADAIVAATKGENERQTERARISEVIAQLSLQDSRVLKLACETTIRSGHDVLKPEDIETEAEECDISPTDLLDSIEVLHSDGLVKSTSAVNKRVVHFRITPRGFGLYARQFLPNYQELRQQIAETVVGRRLLRSPDLAEAVGRDESVVMFMLRELEQDGYLELSKEVGLHRQVSQVHPKLKRLAQS